MSLLMLFVGCICPMQEIQNENENVAQIRGVMYMKIIAIIEDDQHIGDVLERTLSREGYGKPPYAAVCLLESGESEVICLHGGLRLCRPYIGRMAKNFRPSGDILRLIYSRFVQFMGVLCNGV